MKYFDYNATTPVHPKVVEAMNRYYLEDYGNAGSAHSTGYQAFEGVQYGRTQAAQFLGVDPTEIIITSGGTEADNMALQGFMLKSRKTHTGKPPHLITCNIEHPAVYNTALYLRRIGFDISILPVDHEGRVSASDIEEAIKPETKLISIHYANNEIGTIEPIKEIGKLAHKHGIWLHTDAVQAFGKVAISPKLENIDMLSVSAHKYYGPKGIGFLFVRNDPDLEKNESSASKYLQPLFYGGSQEFDLRPATENVPGIVGMGKAIEIARADLEEEQQRLVTLRDYMIKHILAEIPNSSLNGSLKHRLPNNINICFRDLFAYDLMIELDNVGIACSVGAACHAGDTKPSRILLHIGRSAPEAESSLRFSLGRWTTQEDVDILLGYLDTMVPTLRKQFRN